MKLVLREYLASLKERDELDAILPDLLSELGLTVFSRPGRGTRQDGVDIAAVGCFEDDVERVYLLSVKSGDLTRTSWSGNSEQALRPSLEEILDSYIPNRLPVEHRGKPIVICLCFGGEIKEQVRPQVEGFLDRNSRDGVEFQEWHGDRLADIILAGFLREELLPSNFQSSLRKSLALLDEPDVSCKYFSQLISAILSNSEDKRTVLISLRQICICLWMLFSWCRRDNNLEAAYKAAELSLLHAWNVASESFNEKDKLSKQIQSSFFSVFVVYDQITTELNSKIIPLAEVKHGMSKTVGLPCKVAVNFRMFDVLSRMAMHGLWFVFFSNQLTQGYDDMIEILREKLRAQYSALKQLIVNNPTLCSPFKDDQAIDISLALLFLGFDRTNHYDLKEWLNEIVSLFEFSYIRHGRYTCNLHSYIDVLDHPLESTDSYREEMTAGSILLPFCAAFAAIFNFDDIYSKIQRIKENDLQHCNFQFWYPNKNSEERFYNDLGSHGSTFSGVPVEESKEDFLKVIFGECEETDFFENMSAVKYNFLPIILLGCRHYRLPVPIQFLKILNENLN
ncbi:hypothetical protein [Maridesulfovibrio sp.]|uniref:hypothetical protein n=1 Tax=Maridesulfovibrio sp. TaxID=2795000 RepID=UPI0029F48273|nr:hypothetical protein [Maridesulfovibrio sp.]